MFAQMLEDGMRQGVFRDVSPFLMAGWILAMVQRTVIPLKADELTLDEQEVLNRTVSAAAWLTQVRDDETGANPVR